MIEDGATGARRNEVTRSEPINEQFASYVQSTAFTLSLGRTHVRALQHLAIGDKLWTYGSVRMSPTALHGLERRGLVTHRPYVGEPPPFGDDSQVWELTTAGKLVALLLLQPGIMSAFPPPPPGWTDPHPKIKHRADGSGFDLLPSERELATVDL